MKQKLLSILVLLSLTMTASAAIGKQTTVITIDDFDDYTSEYLQVEGGVNVNYRYKDSEGVFKVTQRQLEHAGDTWDEDGITAFNGVTITKLGDQWITSMVIKCHYKATDEVLNENELHINSGSFVITRGNSETTITITGINSDTFEFTCDNSAPQFNDFEISYYEGEPKLLNTRQNLSDLVAFHTANPTKKVIPYHTRQFKQNVAATICLPFGVTEYSSGQLYSLVDVLYDESINEWVATMESTNKVNTPEAGTPYLFMPSEDGEVSFYGDLTTDILSSVTGYDNTILTVSSIPHEGDYFWMMTGTYKRFSWDANMGDYYGFSSYYKTGEDGKVTGEVDYEGKDVEPGDFVHAVNGAYWPEYRAFLKWVHEPLASRGGVPAQAPQRVIVRLVNADGSMTKLDAVKMEENGKVWYDLQGRSYNSKPTKAGIYVNNGKKQIVK